MKSTGECAEATYRPRRRRARGDPGGVLGVCRRLRTMDLVNICITVVHVQNHTPDVMVIDEIGTDEKG